MRKLIKTAVCLALCLSLMLGSSMAAMAASGTISYSSFIIKYNTSATNAKITVTGFPDSSYAYVINGTVCEAAPNGLKCDTVLIWGVRGSGATGSLVANATPDSGFAFSNKHPENNRATLKRGRTVALTDLVDLFNFKFNI